MEPLPCSQCKHRVLALLPKLEPRHTISSSRDTPQASPFASRAVDLARNLSTRIDRRVKESTLFQLITVDIIVVSRDYRRNYECRSPKNSRKRPHFLDKILFSIFIRKMDESANFDLQYCLLNFDEEQV